MAKKYRPDQFGNAAPNTLYLGMSGTCERPQAPFCCCGLRLSAHPVPDEHGLGRGPNFSVRVLFKRLNEMSGTLPPEEAWYKSCRTRERHDIDPADVTWLLEEP